MRRVALIAGVPVAAILYLYLVFLLGFYSSYRPVEGYSCRPTITFQGVCTGPEGQTWKVGDR